jgi:hypothetical protein
MTFAYLASPYTNPDDPADRLYCELRFAEACAGVAKLMARGKNIFCPIAHSHPIAAYLPAEQRCSHQFWLTQDFAVLAKAERLIVLMLHQWERSYGIQQEIMFARKHDIPVHYLDPEDL